MRNTYFITGIGTEVGKTIASAIIVEALQADYWKPIQSGDLNYSDTDRVRRLISNRKSSFHPNSIALETPMSPHAAAEIDGIDIQLKNVVRPIVNNNLVIEGAGGLLVPLNRTDTICDLIEPKDKVIIISRHYLGSINHTLLTVALLKSRNLQIHGIVFNGGEHESTERIILEMTQVPMLGRIANEPYFDKNVVKEYATQFQNL